MVRLLRSLLGAVVALGMGGMSGQAQILGFKDLAGWANDDHRAALRTFMDTCSLLEDPDWVPICRLAPQAIQSRKTAQEFFERLFRPVQIGALPALFTGYYEPELAGSLTRTTRYQYPIYARPHDVIDGQQWLSRAQIETTGALHGRGLEIVWLDDPVEVFFLQVQGSGRIRLTDGSVLRVGYGGKNGHPYRSVGKELIRRGSHTPEQVSAQTIKAWVRANPITGADLLHHNPSFVFFRKLPDLPPEKGPIGAMDRSITALRSIAVDPAFVTLGTPVWIEKAGEPPLHRLMIAQDTGSAIKGAQRADIFFGTGDAAGKAAGTVKDGGRMIVLLPIARADALLLED